MDMSIEQFLNEFRARYGSNDFSGVNGVLAVQVNVTGNPSGIFYIEIKDHRISAEPYDYYDRNAAVTASLSDFSKLLDGSLDPVWAYTTKKINVEGDLGRFVDLIKML